MAANNTINKSICPLCGEPNLCASAADPNAKDCWCVHEEFPQELLDLVPKNLERKVCICKKCLDNFKENNKG